MSPAETRIKRKIEEAGRPLKDWDIQINYGIKTGFNDAFIIDGWTKDELIRKDANSAELIRPVIRGKDIKRYFTSYQDLWIIFAKRGVNISAYPEIESHLLQYKTYLSPKPQDFNGEWGGRKSGSYKWYELQDAVDYWKELEKPKIIWGNLNVGASFAFDNESRYILAPCNLLTSNNKNLYYLLAVLNSSVTTYFMKQQGYSREGGYVEYKKVFIEQLSVAAPFPKLEEICTTYIQEVTTLKKKQMNTNLIEDEIDNLIFDLYNFDSAERALLVKS